jgi:1,4-alpha-glucan branching enzyme
MSIEKQFLKSRGECKVKFRVPREHVRGATAVHLVGDFNGWNLAATPMDELKSGDFCTVLYLEPDQAYQFRYLVDSTEWLTDEEADHLVPAPYPDAQNSVVVT